jgi:small subunit ribosomal protein S8
MMTDPISDMLTRIRNAAMVKAREVEMPLSRMKFAIAKILEAEGFLSTVETGEKANRPMLRMKLRYDVDGASKVSSLKRVSKPGRRVYVKADDLTTIRSGYGIAILSTPNGLMTSAEARKRRLGGELICEVY